MLRNSLMVALAALLLAGCATQMPAPGALSQLPERYTVNGRVAVNAAGKGYSARFSWVHDDQRDTVDVSNPLGQTMARVELDPKGARFFDSDGKLRSADDVEALSERELGWRLPASGLRFWLLGLAAPDRPAFWTQDDNHRLLEQDGWQIRFPLDAGTHAPSRLTLNRPDLEVRIALYDWQLSSTQP